VDAIISFLLILRHNRIAITRQGYTEVSSTALREALRRLGQWLEDVQTPAWLPQGPERPLLERAKGLVTWARSEGLEPPTF
jgi:hypothetical protein